MRPWHWRANRRDTAPTLEALEEILAGSMVAR